MDAKVRRYGKKAFKFAGAACAATGVIAISALVASGAAVGAMVEGFKSAKGTMKRVLEDGEKEVMEIKVSSEVDESEEEKMEL